MRLYLASTSPARLATLRAAGIEPLVLPSHVDEEAAVRAAGPLEPATMVAMLARLKAEAVLGPDIDGLVLGCDSAFELDGVAYGKPHEPAVARERWRMQRGRSGVLHSAHWLVDHRGGGAHGAAGTVASTTVRFADDIDDEEIEAYIATGEPLEVAGAFTLDARGAGFIRGVEGDPHAVVGLSVAGLRALVRSFDIRWPALWNREPGGTR
ncbi:MAG: nucleoside triphosphate pyrophosphatase [Microbacteriaceae bacterium]